MGKVEKITEEVIENEQEVKELLSKQSIEDLYEFFLAKDSTLTEEEFNDEVYDILEYYLKNISKEIKKLEENETKQIVGGKSDIIKKSLSASLCLLTLTSGINASASPTSVNPSSQKAVSVWNNKKQEKSVTFGEKIKAWVKKNKKALIITGSVTAAVIAGIIITVVVYKNKKNVKQPKDNINVPIKQTVGQPNNKSEQQSAEQPKKDGQSSKKSSKTPSAAKSKPTATPSEQPKKETGQPPKKTSTATSTEKSPTVHERRQAVREAQEAAQKEREAETQQQLSSKLKTCENLTNAANGKVEKAKKLAETAKLKAANTNDAYVVTKLGEVNQFMEEANKAAQRAQKALNAAKEAKDLKALEAAEAEIRAARDSAETAVCRAESTSRQLNARLNGVAVDDIAASKNPPNPLGCSRSVSVSGSRPDAKYEPSTVERLSKDAGNSIPNGIVGDGVAAIEERGGGPAVSPGGAMTPKQQEQQIRNAQKAWSENRSAKIFEMTDTYKDHKKNIDELFDRFKLARKEKLPPNEISVRLKRFQEEQMRIERCLKNLGIIKDNIGNYGFKDLEKWYREIVDKDFKRYSELVEHAEKMFNEECKNDIYMNDARNQVRQELEKRFKQAEDSQIL